MNWWIDVFIGKCSDILTEWWADGNIKWFIDGVMDWLIDELMNEWIDWWTDV